MLAVANGLGFDVVQISTSGEVRGGGDEQKHPACQYGQHNHLRFHSITPFSF
jgi:hypothetical protein